MHTMNIEGHHPQRLVGCLMLETSGQYELKTDAIHTCSRIAQSEKNVNENMNWLRILNEACFSWSQRYVATKLRDKFKNCRKRSSSPAVVSQRAKRGRTEGPTTTEKQRVAGMPNYRPPRVLSRTEEERLLNRLRTGEVSKSLFCIPSLCRTNNVE